MRCPIDDAELIMTERHGVEIDYCPKCRGVWLDRGELDKIIEKAVPPMAQPEPAPPAREYRETQKVPAPQPRAEPYREGQRDRDRREWREPHRDHERGKRYSKKRKMKSFLEDIFDFD